MFKRKSKSDRYLEKAMKDIKKINKKIAKAKLDGERHVDIYWLFILSSKWNSDVFRDTVEFVFNYFKAKGYTIKYSDNNRPSIGTLIVRWHQ